jgi:hypothetical protein
MNTKKYMKIFSLLMTMTFLLSMLVACSAPTPETITVEVEKVVEKTVVVESVVEKEVVVTELVEVPAEHGRTFAS